MAMNWFYSKKRIVSQKNKEILVRRTWGVWEVTVDGCGETTEYTRAMWKEAFGKVNSPAQVRSILMLGLAAGGQIKTLHKRFPRCEITAVEFDEEMLQLARELALHKPYSFPHVVFGDARDVVLTLQETFDLIIVDLFVGEEPPFFVTEPAYIATLRSKLSEGGRILVNVYLHPDYLAPWKEAFSGHIQWKFRLNHLGLFW